MKLKQVFGFMVALTTYSCNIGSPNKMSFKFDTKDYLLVNSRVDSNGVTYFEVYRNKYDTSRVLAKSYWNNGKIQNEMFFTGRLRMGPYRNYDTSGTIDFETVYINNEKTGMEIEYNLGKVSEITLFMNNQKQGPSINAKQDILK
jgi:antitoxin component YwqK of YwqJK toxin-antitoxin module